MKTFIKIILGVVLGISLVCVVGAVITLGVTRVVMANSSTEEVEAAAAEISDFDLPEGYFYDYSAHIAGFTLAAYRNGDRHSHLFLAQGPSGLRFDEDALARMAGSVVTGRRDDTTRLTLVEVRPVMVRGQITTVDISDGVSSTGAAYRQAALVFQGNHGPAILIFSEPLASWDETRLSELIDSIR